MELPYTRNAFARMSYVWTCGSMERFPCERRAVVTPATIDFAYLRSSRLLVLLCPVLRLILLFSFSKTIITREDSPTQDVTRHPYSDFLQNLTDFVLPVFEGSVEPPPPLGVQSSTPQAAPELSKVEVTRENFNGGADIGGGGDGAGGRCNAAAGGAAPPEGGCVASETSGASTSSLPPPSPSGVAASAMGTAAASMARVLELETAGGSSAEGDLEIARSLLPDPTVPAPDPKILPIPADKVRQLVRRPAPRMQRTPLTR